MKLYKLLPILVILAILIAGCGNKVVDDTTQEVPVPGMGDEVNEMIVSDDTTSNGDVLDENINVKTFTITGENFKFLMDEEEAPELRVNEGDTIRIEFTATSGFHDWVVDEFSAATEKVRDGGSTSVEFVANKKGTFEYYCSVGSHREQGMVGNLIVE